MPLIKTSSPEETSRIGEKLGTLLRAGDVVCLNGDLGVGKTRFSQGLACGIGVSEPVTSPTFTIINEYQGRLPFYHMDVYRLNDPLEMEDLGYEDYFYSLGVTVIEWAERVAELLPAERLDIVINRCPEGENIRSITLIPHGEGLAVLVKELMKLVCIGN
ncbi:MAG: tRNA (adenosine(37)-N6)-threonylcarbamoyltransferase complex ATPase subunit type 1 TsaE [Desulfotomaculaceae bacterium]|nr:tRNA (adenosine(37)-N6)-threonylcarbamoyltransferase complex ATPase subunit type 1 TsaE [Desulfotomaculaceae bacterium]